ncbi:MAG: glycosyltransferase family 9 protein [Planctomycetota bacterium]|jgi:ADP-heptose:LPS heptosyltransferase
MRFQQILNPDSPYRVVLWNHQKLLGDRILMTPLVRDLAKTYPRWRLVVDVEDDAIWRENPHVEQIVTPGQAVEGKVDFTFNVGPGKATQGSRTNAIHVTRAFAHSWILQTGMPLQDGPFKPDLHLSEAEAAWRPIEGDYWVLNCDTANMGSKRWVAKRWRELVAGPLQGIRFVQVGLAHDARIDLGDEPNVISLLGKTSIRQLFSIVAGSIGCISLISSLQHIAAAFDKPAVILAGGREPRSFCAYPAQAHIDRIGYLKCCETRACWKNSIEACVDKSDDVPRCMRMIVVREVADAVENYYAGGVLEGKLTATMPIKAKLDEVAFAAPPRRRLIRIVSNGSMLGGAERSVANIVGQFHAANWDVELATRQPICEAMRAAVPAARLTASVTAPCDILLLYASDMVWDFHKPEFAPLGECKAERRVMALTYKYGKAGRQEAAWSINWDRYLFLCTQFRDGWLERYYGMPPSCAVLAPPIDIEHWLAIEPNYDSGAVVRWSSQGDDKWDEASTKRLLRACRDRHFRFMPPPSWLEQYLDEYASCPLKVTGYPENEMDPILLAQVSAVFCYLLPAAYSDQGPRVIVEAMAAGLPIIAENRWGARDRVTPETGWLLDEQDGHDAAIPLLENLTPDLLRAKGQAAKVRARVAFDPRRWFAAIVGEEYDGSIHERSF